MEISECGDTIKANTQAVTLGLGVLETTQEKERICQDAVDEANALGTAVAKNVATELAAAQMRIQRVEECLDIAHNNILLLEDLERKLNKLRL